MKSDHSVTTTFITNLYPLELECKLGPPNGGEPGSTLTDVVDSIPLDESISGLEDVGSPPHFHSSQRPVRRAAQKFRENFARWLGNNDV